MKKILLLTLLLSCIGSVYAQKQKTSSDESYNQIIEKFFDIYKTQGPDIAVAYIYSNSSYIEVDNEQLSAIKLKLMSAVDVLGKYCGYEKVSSSKIGESMVIISYMVKYLRQPLYFTFRIYKPEQQWQVQGIRFDDKLTEDVTKDLLNKTVDN